MRFLGHVVLTSLMLFTMLCNHSCADATYELVFDSDWSSSTHPGAYPPAAHFSPLIGGTHNSAVSYWEVGGIASSAIEQMAETGGTSQLRNAVQADIASGNAAAVVTAGGIPAPGTRTHTFTVTPEHPLLSLVTMVAPSPDWFIGVSGLDLRENGRWRSSFSLDLTTYDSGTDSGTNFTSPNANISAHVPIVAVEAPLTGLPVLGTFSFELVQSAPLCDVDSDGDCSINDLNQLLSLGPLAAGVSVVHGQNDQFDINGDGTIDLGDRDDWLSAAATENGFGSAYLPADSDLDGDVDGRDFLAWNAHRATTSLLASHGDFTGDGFIDGADLNVWNQSKFTTIAALAAVPEPVGGLVWVFLFTIVGRSKQQAVAN